MNAAGAVKSCLNRVVERSRNRRRSSRIAGMCLAVTGLLAAPIASSSPGGQTQPERLVALRFGRLVEASGRSVTSPVILVRGDRILSIGSAEQAIPAEAEVHDLRAYTALPGLIDVHTHLTYYWDRTNPDFPWDQLERRSAAETVFLAQENARQTLEAGVTTVRDLGAFEYTDIAMRELIRRGQLLGPRMLVSGYGLHIVDHGSGLPASPKNNGIADGPEQLLRRVREQVAMGADWIKIYASSGSGDDVSGTQTYTFDELAAAIGAAHVMGKRVAVHSYGPQAARDAVRAGADSLEHAIDLDDETLSELRKRRTFYVPTVDHNRYYMDNAKLFGITAEALTRMRAFLQKNLATVRRAHQAGVRMAMGSDALMTMCGQNTRELSWFVQAGLTPLQALGTATTNAAALLGMEHSLGSLAPGFAADVIAVEGDPTQDVGAIINGVRWVMKGGKVMLHRLPSVAPRCQP